MKTEKEMYELILGFAKTNPLIRAVGLNGSRAYGEGRTDIFSDFDIVYLVTDLDPFVRDDSWLNYFGEILILQKPDDMGPKPKQNRGRYAYLTQFKDGNRIDFTVVQMRQDRKQKSIGVVLLDKDQLFLTNPRTNEGLFLIKKPSEKAFRDCCNEFWWVAVYAAKGLWRKEILYATDHLESHIRKELLKMLEWQVGFRNHFQVSTGKSQKYLLLYLTEKQGSDLMTTYDLSGYDQCWKALFQMMRLFGETARNLALKLGYAYVLEEEENVIRHVTHIYELPDDSAEIY
jgi:aminoglycoside 6-adenylyltransferase